MRCVRVRHTGDGEPSNFPSVYCIICTSVAYSRVRFVLYSSSSISIHTSPPSRPTGRRKETITKYYFATNNTCEFASSYAERGELVAEHRSNSCSTGSPWVATALLRFTTARLVSRIDEMATHTHTCEQCLDSRRRVRPSALAPCSSPITEAEQSKRRRSQLADRISNKLHALFWVVVGATVVYRTDFVRVLMEDERVNR